MNVIPIDPLKAFVQDTAYEAHLAMSLAHRALNRWRDLTLADDALAPATWDETVERLRATALTLTAYANAIAGRNPTKVMR